MPTIPSTPDSLKGKYFVLWDLDDQHSMKYECFHSGNKILPYNTIQNKNKKKVESWHYVLRVKLNYFLVFVSYY